MSPKGSVAVATPDTSNAGHDGHRGHHKGHGGNDRRLPFKIAGRQASRQSFNIPTTAIAAAATTILPVQQIPAVGYLRYINLEVTVAMTAGAGLTADAPFNA